MSATTDHTVRLLTRAEIDADARLGFTRCTRDKCDGLRVYCASRRNSVGAMVRERLCVSHAATYANRHDLTLPPLPQRPRDHVAPLPASVVALRGHHIHPRRVGAKEVVVMARQTFLGWEDKNGLDDVQTGDEKSGGSS